MLSFDISIILVSLLIQQGGMLDNVGTDITVLALYKGRDMCKHSVGGKQGRF
jgi:hypothetical protein